jgi:hypothetical protein
MTKEPNEKRGKKGHYIYIYPRNNKKRITTTQLKHQKKSTRKRPKEGKIKRAKLLLS